MRIIPTLYSCIWKHKVIYTVGINISAMCYATDILSFWVPVTFYITFSESSALRGDKKSSWLTICCPGKTLIKALFVVDKMHNKQIWKQI